MKLPKILQPNCEGCAKRQEALNATMAAMSAAVRNAVSARVVLPRLTREGTRIAVTNPETKTKKE